MIDPEFAVELPNIGAVVNIDDAADPKRCGEIAHSWIDCATTILWPEMWRRMQDGDPVLQTAIGLTPYVGGPITSSRFTPRKWTSALGALDNHPESVGYSATELKLAAPPGSTYFPEDEVRSISVDARFAPETGLQLSASVSAPTDDEMHTRWLTFLRTTLQNTNPSYGEAGQYGDTTHTGLDHALNRDVDESVAQARQWLRGYEWATVVPQDLVPALGDLDALQRVVAGAFPIEGGGLLIHSTNDPFAFDDAALHQLFRGLTPVLPPGQPRRGTMGPYEEARVVFEDASAAR